MRSRSGTESSDCPPVSGKFSPLPVMTWPLVRTHFLALIVIPLAVFGFVVGTSGSVAGRISAVLACLTLLLGYGLLIIATARRRSTALGTSATDDGVTINGLRSVATILIAMVFCATGFPIAFAIGVFQDGVEPGSSAMFVTSLMVEVTLIPVVVMLVLGRFRINRLVLTRSTIAYVGYRKTRTVTWDELDRVELREKPQVAVVLSGQNVEFSVPFGLLAAGPVPLAEYLDDLLRNPKSRPSRP